MVIFRALMCVSSPGLRVGVSVFSMRRGDRHRHTLVMCLVLEYMCLRIQTVTCGIRDYGSWGEEEHLDSTPQASSIVMMHNQ